MSRKKKGAICFLIMLSIAALCGCSSKEYGTKAKPASVRQTMYYDGLEALKERNRFKAEITLEDVVRGEAAQDIFAAAGGYADYHEALKLDEEEELMVARFTFALTEVEGNSKVDIGDRDVSMFNLISEDGTSYDYFQQRSYIDGNLFENADKGTTQTGAIFFIVNKDDKNPAIVFLPSVKDGIWFKTSLNEDDKEKVENPLVAADWLDADGKLPVYAGTLNTPLPIGEFGYMKCRSSYFGEYEIELKVNDVLRGKKAEDQLYDLNIYGIEDQKLLESQEFIMIHVTANVPSADLLDEDLLIIDSLDFGVVNSKTGEAYDYENILYIRPYDLCGIAPGGTATGWIGLIIDKADDSPMMYYQSLDDKMLYFKLDKAYDLPDDYSSYQSSPIFAENPIRDVKQEKGGWKNPYKMGETVALNYAPKRVDKLSSPFTGNICIQEAYKGELAEKFMDSTFYWPEPNMELIVLKLAVNVVSVEGDQIPKFNADNYTILNGQGGQLVARSLSANTLKIDGIEEVYPGGKTEGYAAFFVPNENDNLVMTYGDEYTGLDNKAWISLEFADSIPEEVAEKLEDEHTGPYLVNDEDNYSKSVLTAMWSDNESIAIVCMAVGKEGRIQELDTQWGFQFNEDEAEEYYTVLKQSKDIVTELSTGGRDIVLESFDEQRTIIITETNIYGEEKPYEIGFMLEKAGISLSDISDENEVPSMDRLETILRSNGFLIVDNSV